MRSVADLHGSYHLRLVRRGIGDTVAASGLIRDLVAARPDIRISLDGPGAGELFAGDGRVYAERDPAAAALDLDYRPTIDRRADPGARYFYAAHEAFERATGVTVPRGPARPSLVRPPGPAVPGGYALVLAGSKADIPVKQVPIGTFQAVVDATRGWNWVQAGALFDGRFGEYQVALDGAANRLGRTSLTDLMALVAGADVVLCHLSLPMTLASAFDTPCVVLAGGRESPHLFAGSGPVLLDTIGRLPCCATGGCHASAALVGRRAEEFPPGWLCADPVGEPGGRAFGRCMTLLEPTRIVEVLEAVRRELPLPTSRCRST